MLKRIVVLGDARADEFAQAARDRGAEVVTVASDRPVPAGSSAVVVPDGQWTAGLDAALKMASWNEQLLLLLAQAIDCREEFQPGSSLRVWEHAVRFGEALGLSSDDRLTLERGALVRDIGKLRIPNEILLKDAILTYDEWEAIRQHPAQGAAMVREMDVLADTAEVVHYHHECFDGSGYPEGLEGDAIPPLARAMKILDVYCAMTSRRHYRPGLSSTREALEHLQAEAGTRFDPEMVRIFVERVVPTFESVPSAGE